MARRYGITGNFWHGRCPLCPRNPEMLMNDKGYWECPVCHKQIRQVSENRVKLLGERGKGKFVEIRHETVKATTELNHTFVISAA